MKVEAIELQLQDYATNSHKFYRVYHTPTNAMVHFGRIGTKGQAHIVRPSDALARVQEKLAKGYATVVPWTKFEIALSNWNVENVSSAFNQAIGNNVTAAPIKSTAVSAQEQEEDFKKSLLAMATRYSQNPETSPEPEVDGIEAQLQAALAKAKSSG